MAGYGDDDALCAHFEELKQEWWNVVVNNSWKYVGGAESEGM
ncbi:hypothetical protein [Phocaeicola sp.]|nr:hypothetical protein [Phocaeicola sp.]